MAGTLFGLGLSQQNDINGRPMSGCLLYIFAASTGSPVTAYTTQALTQELPWPLEADANGRIPAFWLADGSYRARLTNAAGVVQFDEDGILAVGAAAEAAAGDVIDDAAIFTTGDVCWRPVNTTKDGWARLNGRTIGNATSGASERANADTEDLYTFLYDNFADAICAVSSGRGVSAASDFAASKTIALLDMRTKAPFGLDDMGNAAAGGFAGVSFDLGNATTGGAAGGDATKTLTTGQLPAHTHTGTTASDGAHTHNYTDPTDGAGQNAGGAVGTSINSPTVEASPTTSNGAHTHTFTTASTGSGTAIDAMNPFILGTWYMRL
jgi:hypothetical protein